MKQTGSKKARRSAPGVTAAELIAAAKQRAVTPKKLLNDAQLAFVAEILESNDSTNVAQNKVGIRAVHRALVEHHGLTMGIGSFEVAVCQQLGRASWGQPQKRSA